MWKQWQTRKMDASKYSQRGLWWCSKPLLYQDDMHWFTAQQFLLQIMHFGVESCNPQDLLQIQPERVDQSWPSFDWNFTNLLWKKNPLALKFRLAPTSAKASKLLHLICSIWGLFTSLCHLFPNSEKLRAFQVTTGIKCILMGMILQNQAQRSRPWCGKCSRILVYNTTQSSCIN